METISKNELKRLHTLLHNANMMESKRELVSYYTGGRTTSSREMTHEEYQMLIDHLLESDPNQRMRRKVFAIAYEIGIAQSGDETEHKINSAALDMFLIKNSYLYKKLNDYSTSELPKLVSQIEQISKHLKQRDANKAVKDLLDEIGIQH